MKRTLVNLYVEEAPVDAFDPDGDQQYQVVAVDRAEATVWHLTDRHSTRERAMDQLRRSIQASATRYELAMIDGSLHRRIGKVEDRLDAVVAYLREVCTACGVTLDGLRRVALRAKTELHGMYRLDPFREPEREHRGVVANLESVSVRPVDPEPDRAA